MINSNSKIQFIQRYVKNLFDRLHWANWAAEGQIRNGQICTSNQYWIIFYAITQWWKLTFDSVASLALTIKTMSVIWAAHHKFWLKNEFQIFTNFLINSMVLTNKSNNKYSLSDFHNLFFCENMRWTAQRSIISQPYSPF